MVVTVAKKTHIQTKTQQTGHRTETYTQTTTKNQGVQFPSLFVEANGWYVFLWAAGESA